MCCDNRSQCRNPDKLVNRARDCSPEQVSECHGDIDKHPCTSGGKKGKGE